MDHLGELCWLFGETNNILLWKVAHVLLWSKAKCFDNFSLQITTLSISIAKGLTMLRVSGWLSGPLKELLLLETANDLLYPKADKGLSIYYYKERCFWYILFLLLMLCFICSINRRNSTPYRQHQGRLNHCGDVTERQRRCEYCRQLRWVICLAAGHIGAQSIH